MKTNIFPYIKEFPRAEIHAQVTDLLVDRGRALPYVAESLTSAILELLDEKFVIVPRPSLTPRVLERGAVSLGGSVYDTDELHLFTKHKMDHALEEVNRTVRTLEVRRILLKYNNAEMNKRVARLDELSNIVHKKPFSSLTKKQQEPIISFYDAEKSL